MRKRFSIPLLASCLLAISCNNATSLESPTSVDGTAPAPAPEVLAQAPGEMPVEVRWAYCDTSLFPPNLPEFRYATNADGCRIGDQQIQAWPLEDGTVEVYFVRGRMSPSTLSLGEAEGYWVATKSRGCDPDGPQEEGFYRMGGSVAILVDAANDQKFIQVPEEDVSLSAIAAPDNDGEVIGGFLFVGAGGCESIDPDRVF